MSLDISLATERALRTVHMNISRVQYGSYEGMPEAWGTLVESLVSLNEELPGDFYTLAVARTDDDDLVPTFVRASTPSADTARAVFENLLAARASVTWMANFMSAITSLRSAVELLRDRCPHFDVDEQHWAFPD